MKKILIFSVLMALLPLISYSQNTNSPNAKAVRFIIDDDVQPRIGSTPRYIVEVYEIENGTTPVLLSHIEQNTNEFTVSLDPEVSYSCLFWADDGTADANSGTFDASDLRSVTLNSDHLIQEAFSCKEDFMMTDNINSTSIILRRAVAQVELIESGTVSQGVNIEVSFDGYEAFDVYTQTVTGNSIPITATITTSATTDLVGSFLTFASAGTVTSGGIEVDLTAVYSPGTITNVIPDVRLSTNHITKVHGEFATP